jgi:hypothetical protein
LAVYRRLGISIGIRICIGIRIIIGVVPIRIIIGKPEVSVDEYTGTPKMSSPWSAKRA